MSDLSVCVWSVCLRLNAGLNRTRRMINDDGKWNGYLMNLWMGAAVSSSKQKLFEIESSFLDPASDNSKVIPCSQTHPGCLYMTGKIYPYFLFA